MNNFTLELPYILWSINYSYSDILKMSLLYGVFVLLEDLNKVFYDSYRVKKMLLIGYDFILLPFNLYQKRVSVLKQEKLTIETLDDFKN